MGSFDILLPDGTKQLSEEIDLLQYMPSHCQDMTEYNNFFMFPKIGKDQLAWIV